MGCQTSKSISEIVPEKEGINIAKPPEKAPPALPTPSISNPIITYEEIPEGSNLKKKTSSIIAYAGKETYAVAQINSTVAFYESGVFKTDSKTQSMF